MCDVTERVCHAGPTRDAASFLNPDHRQQPARQMASNIPDETLHEVLSHAVRVYSFTHNLEFGGPYGSHSPTTNALLVCKRWLRVATPVFYQYVRVANAKQMQKLAQTLRAHPQLGLMIRGLYLSGGYGINLYAVARHAPNIQDLFICPNMTSKDSNAGFLRALSLLKPKRLHVGCENGPSRSVKVQQLRQALLRGVQEWTTLVSPRYISVTLSKSESGAPIPAGSPLSPSLVGCLEEYSRIEGALG